MNKILLEPIFFSKGAGFSFSFIVVLLLNMFRENIAQYSGGNFELDKKFLQEKKM